MRVIVWNSIAILGLLFLMQPCRAELVRFEIGAIVDSIFDPGDVVDDISVNDPLTGVLQYELDLLDVELDSDFGRYILGPSNSIENNFIQGAIGGSGFFQTTLDFDVFINNDSLNLNGADDIEFRASGDTTPSSTANPGIDRVETIINFNDPSGTAISDDSLPTDLILSDFSGGVISIIANPPSSPSATTVYSITASITSITLVNIGQDGDFDGDEDVDGNDFLYWQRELGDTPNLDLWEANYGEGVGTLSATSVVPEPTSALLIAVGLICASRRCRV